MAATFSRTLHNLEADGARRTMLWIGIVLLWLGAWLAWFSLAPVTAYVSSTSARLEVAQTAVPVQAPVSGRLVSSHLVLDEEVAADELLIELDSTAQQIALEDQRVKVEALEREMASLDRELKARQQSLEECRHAAQAGIEEARARFQEADVSASAGEAEVERTGVLQSRGLVSTAEVDRLRAEARSQRAAAEALSRALARTGSEQRMKERTLIAELATLERELAQLMGQKATAEQAIRRLEYELALRSLRAPVAGRVGEVAALVPGAYVTEGLRLGAIVPAGGVRVIAEFPATEAVGKLSAGQSARLRLDAFPWMQFGSLGARVERVANEAREGRIRVELSVQPAPGSAVPVQHGLQGTVEVAVEQTTPAMLVLRAAGGALRHVSGTAP